ncbi:tRNA cyclic N6-threonylcarbamoyladenosine(37) synthase TcdA [Marinomonas mediterranea]|uniref:tRNA threonylcarbamoyladenosine dehydratase n=1 Tax=Marinomonas mediterranea (strain ATCC 700492 / JCM 21426 / NBRC 103028 / MMB-1) TaxID=717774 RepID=F2K1S4_MARM1|nr:tRNA cyclic N6-threonylcarbamoyladenosine(37) synthase TcdA [Marinomonas mediterranea]ADZ93408.1 UBA/THIF-type NAD/FAD binding protein [Marinomonas mediterranea MMB-1]WCN11295.1 tRNA cyclic N6-threonylcarbamoyladenosine(37) synthase TcdA [Marinomonas mediterranea]WCN15360.1 tRNA cyclic N6-threonylcarbamoyladenosine(37) synthase TcdA [Marinomonas mediterranea]WCN19400.1 tRNA cyclic N6-threonylcarbamoyladenosine(37) synthase TcdA [Marinomonas mediterranea MMB-1]
MSIDPRFGGISRLYGQSAYEYFQTAHVCVIGIGGVGSWAAEALARSGIGQITLIDMDDVCVTNTNRQIHALDGNVGKAKVDAMKERILLINPQCQVHCIEDFITPDNIAELLFEPFDYIVDAIDSLKPKAALVAWCRRNKRKVITVGGAGGQMDPTQIQIADLARTERDPLAAKLRNFLRRHYNFSRNTKRRFDIECVYSLEQLKYPQTDGTVCESRQKGDTETKMNCDTGFGASTVVTATFGFVAVSRVLEKLAQKANA